MSTIPERQELATAKYEDAASVVSDIANGDETTEVPTESGPTPTIKKWMKDRDAQLGSIEVNADRAEIASDQAQYSAGMVKDTAEGIATGKRYFSVLSPDSDKVLMIYENVSGAAVDTGKRTPDAFYISALGTSVEKLAPLSAVYKAESKSRAGWYGAQVDKFNRILTGIKGANNSRHHFIKQVFEAAVSVSSVVYGNRAAAYAQSSLRSGYIWVTTDKLKRIIFGQKVDGSIWAWGKRLLSATDRSELEALISAQVPTPATSQVFQAGDTDGRQQIFVRNLTSGDTRQLSAKGSNNADLQVTADGINVMYTSDRSEGMGPGRLAVAIAGGTERLVSPRRDRITAIGDSLTFGQGASNPATESWPAVVGSTQGWVVTNRALQGFTSRSQAALVGAIPTLVTATGNSIGGSGATTVLTAVSTLPLSMHNGSPYDSATRSITGILVGIHGTMRRRPVGTSGAYTDLYEFISDASTATTACPTGSVFVPDGDQRNELLGICLGTNRGVGFVESDDVIKANVAAIIHWAAPLYPKILLFGLAKSSELNAYWRNAFPHYYAVDSSGRDLYQRLLASGNGSEKDLEYLSLGRLPYSLLGDPDSGDYTHLSTAGYAVWAQLANEVIQVRGYSL